jgi:hypothetical protein
MKKLKIKNKDIILKLAVRNQKLLHREFDKTIDVIPYNLVLENFVDDTSDNDHVDWWRYKWAIERSCFDDY